MVCPIDQICLTGGDFVVAAGILLSGGLALWSFIRTFGLQQDQTRLAEEQNELLAEQNELARRQLEDQTPRQSASHHSHSVPPPRNARFKVRLTPSGRSQRIVVQNVGDAQAHNVKVHVDPPRDLIGGSPREFPRLDPGQEWRLLFSRTMGSPDRYQWKITWEEDGQTREQDGWVSHP